MASLAQQLALLTNPTPIFQDPEDVDNNAGAKLTERLGDDDDDSVPVTGTKLRRQAAPLLAEEDTRYGGKKISRKKLQQDDHEMEVQEEDESESEDGEEESEESSEPELKDDLGDDAEEDESIGEESESGDENDSEENDESLDEEDNDKLALANFKKKMKQQAAKEKQEFSFEDDGDYGQYADDYDESEEESESSEEDEDDDESEEEEAVPRKRQRRDTEEREEDGMDKFSKASVTEEVKKGQAARSQLALWESLLKGRIELQKVVTLVNQLPQHQQWQQFSVQGGNTYKDALRDGQQSLRRVLDQLVELQTALLLQNPDTKALVKPGPVTDKTKPKKLDAEEDEEITSDEEDEQDKREEQSDDGDNDDANQIIKQRIKMSKIPEFLAKRHASFRTYRNDTIQKWFDKTRVATGKLSKGFSAFEQSALKQIEQIMSDKERLLRRTQLKRSVYKVLGKQVMENEKEKDEDEDEMQVDKSRITDRDHLKDYDEEIFDDDDFYHQLLRELIERKTSDINDPVALTRQYLEIQKLRNKVKKKVDTKASKGRKIRYNIHRKIVNFMAPVDNSLWTDEAKNDLYSSLFGKRNAGTETATEV